MVGGYEGSFEVWCICKGIRNDSQSKEDYKNQEGNDLENEGCIHIIHIVPNVSGESVTELLIIQSISFCMFCTISF